jgi:hypothetical protein
LPSLLEHLVAVAIPARVFELRVDVGLAQLDGLELITADPPVEDLLFADLRVEPPAGVLLDQGDRQRPGVRPDDDDRPVLRLRAQGPHLLRRVVGLAPFLADGRLVGANDQVAVLVAEDVEQRGVVVVREGLKQGVHGGLGCLEDPLLRRGHCEGPG